MTRGILWLVLTKKSKKKLLTLIPPSYSSVFAHHVTLHYNTPLTDEYKKLISKKFSISLTEDCHNDAIQAVRVELHGISSKNKHPHITISAKEGVEPVESNNMLEGNHSSTQIAGNPLIYAVVEFKEFTK